MLELKTYDTKELCEALNIKSTSFKTDKNKYLKHYEYIEIQKGRSKFYQIINYKEPQKSKFIQLFEQLAQKEVNFPRESIAKLLAAYLFSSDRTMESAYKIAAELGLEEHTVGKYINLFREYGFLPKPEPILYENITDHETGKIITLKYDPNLYTYYKVRKWLDYREEIIHKEYLEMKEFIRKTTLKYMLKGLNESKANEKAFQNCSKAYGGVPVKAFSKIPTGIAYYIFREYFNLPIPKINVAEDKIIAFMRNSYL